MGLFNNNKYPYTDFHELNLDWILCEFKKLKDHIENFIRDINKTIYKIVKEEKLPEVLNGSRYAFDGKAGELYVYIAAFSGNDEDDGTAGRPVKTLQRALEIASRFHNDFRLYFIEAGTYTWEPLVFTGQAIHVHASVAGVNIVSERDMVFYGTHLNILAEEGHEITITVNSASRRFYFDGGQVNLANCHINALVRLNGCGGEFVSCDMPHISTRRGGSAQLIGCKITNNILDTAVFDIQTGRIFIYNSFEILSTENSDSYFINMIGGDFRCQAPIDNPNNITYARGCRLLNGEYLVPKAYNSVIEAMGPVNMSTTILSNIDSLGTMNEIQATSTEITSNSWTPVGSYTVQPGAYIIRCFISCSHVGTNIVGAFRGESPSGNQYEYVNWVADKNGFAQLVYMINVGTETTINFRVQNLSGVTVTFGGIATTLRAY